MAVLENLEPQRVFYYFEEMTKIPHGTFDTKRVSDWCVGIANELGLECLQDDANNVIIKKPATEGYEDAEPVIIQGHLDMVCEKTQDSTHDFSKDPLDIYVEDGFIKARNTTLGADDGIAVAYAFAILESKDIPHPALEVVFTTDEETGMVGANAIDLSVLKGRMLINLDSDVEGTILAGCEGGYEHIIELPVEREEKEGTIVSININGLQGGHSGLDIHEQRGNANKLNGRLLMLLHQEGVDYQIASLKGGILPNVITPFATTEIVVCPCCVDKAVEIIKQYEADLKVEFGADEPNLVFTVETKEGQKVQALTKESTQKVVFFVTTTPDGVQCYSRDIKGLVETSLNLGIVDLRDEDVFMNFRCRSGVLSKKANLKLQLNAWAEYFGAKANIINEYPAWVYKVDSKLRPIVVDTYKHLFDKEPIVTTVHAGLECGLFADKLPGLDSVSFGPAAYEVHSVKERVDIASVERMWHFLKTILRNCK